MRLFPEPAKTTALLPTGCTRTCTRPGPRTQPSIKCSAVGQLWAEESSPAQAATHHLHFGPFSFLFHLISAQFN